MPVRCPFALNSTMRLGQAHAKRMSPGVSMSSGIFRATRRNTRKTVASSWKTCCSTMSCTRPRRKISTTRSMPKRGNTNGHLAALIGVLVQFMGSAPIFRPVVPARDPNPGGKSLCAIRPCSCKWAVAISRAARYFDPTGNAE